MSAPKLGSGFVLFMSVRVCLVRPFLAHRQLAVRACPCLGCFRPEAVAAVGAGAAVGQSRNGWLLLVALGGFPCPGCSLLWAEAVAVVAAAAADRSRTDWPRLVVPGGSPCPVSACVLTAPPTLARAPRLFPCLSHSSRLGARAQV